MGQVEGGNRWDTFLQNGCRTAVEFKDEWSSLQVEVRQYATYLDAYFLFASTEWTFHSGRNEMVHSIPAGMKQLIPARMKWVIPFQL